MSRYRKIEVRTWSDEKFRALDAIFGATTSSSKVNAE